MLKEDIVEEISYLELLSLKISYFESLSLDLLKNHSLSNFNKNSKDLIFLKDKVYFELSYQINILYKMLNILSRNLYCEEKLFLLNKNLNRKIFKLSPFCIDSEISRETLKYLIKLEFKDKMSKIDLSKFLNKDYKNKYLYFAKQSKEIYFIESFEYTNVSDNIKKEISKRNISYLNQYNQILKKNSDFKNYLDLVTYCADYKSGNSFYFSNEDILKMYKIFFIINNFRNKNIFKEKIFAVFLRNTEVENLLFKLKTVFKKEKNLKFDTFLNLFFLNRNFISDIF